MNYFQEKDILRIHAEFKKKSRIKFVIKSLTWYYINRIYKIKKILLFQWYLKKVKELICIKEYKTWFFKQIEEKIQSVKRLYFKFIYLFIVKD